MYESDSSDESQVRAREAQFNVAHGTVTHLPRRKAKLRLPVGPLCAGFVVALAAAASPGCDPRALAGCGPVDPPPTTRRDLGPAPRACAASQPGVTRFAALGDGGTGDQHQYDVAAALERVCCEIGCDFTLYLGDNFYDVGVDNVCGEVDLYFSGHDHNRQWLPETCGTQFVVTGAAGKLTPFEPVPLGGGDRHENEWQDDTRGGFFWGEIRGDTLNARFYNDAGELDFERTITRPSARR